MGDGNGLEQRLGRGAGELGRGGNSAYGAVPDSALEQALHGAAARELAPGRKTLMGAAAWSACLALGIAACAADASGTEPSKFVPTPDALCDVVMGHDPLDTAHEPRTYGTYADDVAYLWGRPSERDGDLWTYEWCLNDACSRKATVTVEFERADLCDATGGKVASGLFVAVISVEGLDYQQCWDPFRGNVKPTCDECSVHTERLEACNG